MQPQRDWTPPALSLQVTVHLWRSERSLDAEPRLTKLIPLGYWCSEFQELSWEWQLISMEHNCVPGPIPSAVTSSHLILTAAPWDRYTSYFHFTDQSMERINRLPRGKGGRTGVWTQVIQSLSFLKLGLEPSPRACPLPRPQGKAPISPTLCHLSSGPGCWKYCTSEGSVYQGWERPQVGTVGGFPKAPL